MTEIDVLRAFFEAVQESQEWFGVNRDRAVEDVAYINGVYDAFKKMLEKLRDEDE